jgi:hypothetical protein
MELEAESIDSNDIVITPDDFKWVNDQNVNSDFFDL